MENYILFPVSVLAGKYSVAKVSFLLHQGSDYLVVGCSHHFVCQTSLLPEGCQPRFARHNSFANTVLRLKKIVVVRIFE